MSGLRHLCAAVGLAVVATPALATPDDFINCDSHRAPSPRNNGLGRPDEAFLAPGAQGVAACTRALADPSLLPGYWVRRASLLRSRAIHRLLVNRPFEALADLRLAGQTIATEGDARHWRNVGLGITLLSAYALLQAGDNAEAARLARDVIDASPANSLLAFAAARIILAATRDWAAFSEVMQRLAVYDPGHLGALFLVAFDQRRYADAIRIHPHIILQPPLERGGYIAERREAIISGNVAMRAEFDGAAAYARAAMGGRDALPAPAMPVSDMNGGAAEVPAQWERPVRLRRMITAGRIDEALAELRANPPQLASVAADMLEAAAAARPTLRADLEAAVAELNSASTRQRHDAFRLTLDSLLGSVRGTEFPGAVIAYDRGSDSLLSIDSNGYRERPGPRAGLLTVNFSSRWGRLPQVSEMALMRAAELARARGSKGFIIVGRRVIERSDVVRIYSTEVSNFSAGFANEIDVLFVDPASLPPEYADMPWRVIDAETIWNALAAIYAPDRARGN